MEKIQGMIENRLQALQVDIESGAFIDPKEFEQEISKLSNVMTKASVVAGVDNDVASDYINEHFVSIANKMYEDYQTKQVVDSIKKPEDYHFANKEEAIRTLIEQEKLEEAKEKIKETVEILGDNVVIVESIQNGLFTSDDVDYFLSVSVAQLNEEIAKKEAEKANKKGFFDRLTSGVVYIATGKNPYDGQRVKVEKEKVTFSEKIDKFKGDAKEFGKKHKGKIALAAGAALLIGGIALGTHLHNKAKENDANSYVETQDETVEFATFEVSENQLFNANNQETHIEKLELLARAFVERGIPVVSEEECMRLSNEGTLAVSPEQLNNWYITINLEEINDLTFTKLLENANTDKEELSSDFTRVCNVLGSIYTTKETNAFIYEFIGNKEYSEYIKAFEEAIIKNQSGEKEALVTLIESRVMNPVSATSSGAIGMLSTSLIYQQANVYNAEVIGQDIMNLYNINNDCREETATTFYSDDWAELMRKMNSKFAASIMYTGSEKEAYDEYLETLTDVQDDNKVYVEEQVLPYLERENVQLGEWDLIDNIANNRETKPQNNNNNNSSNNDKNNQPSQPTTTVTEVPKAPETEEEKAVQEETEKQFDQENAAAFLGTVAEYAIGNGGKITVNANGDFVIQIPGQADIIVDGETMGAYDPTMDYTGPTYNDYNDYRNQHQEDTQYVDGVGNVVVTDQNIEIINPNVYVDPYGVIRDKVTGEVIVIGTEEQIDNYLERNPELGEWTTVGESENNSNGSTPTGVDEDIYNSLTPEERAALEEMLNAGNAPVAGEVVDESFSDIVYGEYTVSQLLNNPALCAYIPEDILKNDFPEIWKVYQEWLASQNLMQTQSLIVSDTAAQLAALQSLRSDLVGNEQQDLGDFTKTK